jgi:hypothetical protein
MKGVLLLVLLFICFFLLVSASDGGAGEVHRMCQQPVPFKPGDEDLDVVCHDPNECSMIKKRYEFPPGFTASYYQMRYFDV